MARLLLLPTHQMHQIMRRLEYGRATNVPKTHRHNNQLTTQNTRQEVMAQASFVTIFEQQVNK
ncbi:hypothetical protein [Pseudodesulfovibrio nedwellii]|uniref:hypothetical protein n=1 Tax=Pseudodesulfovibrio nedwellii TaxID=2973072 RepID=UPI002491EE07|nr:hypothetical protein [Pseudodesulfovibrio nedwellii]